MEVINKDLHGIDFTIMILFTEQGMEPDKWCKRICYTWAVIVSQRVIY